MGDLGPRVLCVRTSGFDFADAATSTLVLEKLCGGFPKIGDPKIVP